MRKFSRCRRHSVKRGRADYWRRFSQRQHAASTGCDRAQRGGRAGVGVVTMTLVLGRRHRRARCAVAFARAEQRRHGKTREQNHHRRRHDADGRTSHVYQYSNDCHVTYGAARTGQRSATAEPPTAPVSDPRTLHLRHGESRGQIAQAYRDRQTPRQTCPEGAADDRATS